MGFFHRFSAFIANWIRIKCVTFSNENGFADQGSPPPKRMGFAARWSLPFFKRFLVSETTGNSSPIQVVSRTRNTNQQRAHGSPSHQGRLRLQVENVHNQLQTILEISMTDVLTRTLTLNSGCSSLHINFVDVFFFIESLFSWCCPTWPSSSNAVSIPVQAVLDPFYMTARVK